jgi:hypothetical protein
MEEGASLGASMKAFNTLFYNAPSACVPVMPSPTLCNTMPSFLLPQFTQYRYTMRMQEHLQEDPG